MTIADADRPLRTQHSELSTFANADPTRTLAAGDAPAPESDARVARSVCPHDCPDTCSMVVHVREGRAVRIHGDPDHPFTRGFLCVKVNNYLDRVYSPERVL